MRRVIESLLYEQGYRTTCSALRSSAPCAPAPVHKGLQCSDRVPVTKDRLATWALGRPTPARVRGTRVLTHAMGSAGARCAPDWCLYLPQPFAGRQGYLHLLWLLTDLAPVLDSEGAGRGRARSRAYVFEIRRGHVMPSCRHAVMPACRCGFTGAWAHDWRGPVRAAFYNDVGRPGRSREALARLLRRLPSATWNAHVTCAVSVLRTKVTLEARYGPGPREPAGWGGDTPKRSQHINHAH